MEIYESSFRENLSQLTTELSSGPKLNFLTVIAIHWILLYFAFGHTYATKQEMKVQKYIRHSNAEMLNMYFECFMEDIAGIFSCQKKNRF